MYALLQTTNDAAIIEEMVSLTKQLATKKNIQVNTNIDQYIGDIITDRIKFKESYIT
ncbi:MAG: hypothetical protein U9N13_03980 [Euryarchaeota archaeon]|nr:hypothetical protein [Euryarchaeota archaeon]